MWASTIFFNPATKGAEAGKTNWFKEDRNSKYHERDTFCVYLNVIDTELILRLPFIEFSITDLETREKN